MSAFAGPRDGQVLDLSCGTVIEQARVVRALAVLLILFASAPARAEGPIVVSTTVGINMPIDGTPLTCFPDPYSTSHRPVLNVDVGYRLVKQLAAGVHVGARTYPWEECATDSLGFQGYRGIATSRELGAGAQWSMSRFWIAGWLGGQFDDDGEGHFTYAVAAGIDVYVHPNGHRVGVYMDFTNPENDFSGAYHFSAGIAYRYW